MGLFVFCIFCFAVVMVALSCCPTKPLTFRIIHDTYGNYYLIQQKCIFGWIYLDSYNSRYTTPKLESAKEEIKQRIAKENKSRSVVCVVIDGEKTDDVLENPKMTLDK